MLWAWLKRQMRQCVLRKLGAREKITPKKEEYGYACKLFMMRFQSPIESSLADMLHSRRLSDHPYGYPSHNPWYITLADQRRSPFHSLSVNSRLDGGV